MNVEHTSNAPAAQEPSFGVADVLGILRKNWWLLLLLAAACATAAGFYSYGQTKIYRAATTIQIDPTPPKPLGQDVQGAVDIGTTVYGNSQYYQTQYEILESRHLAMSTVRRLGLHLDPTFVLNLPPDAQLEPKQQVAFTEDQARAAISRRLTVVPAKDSRLVTLFFEDADPERAKRVLRTLVEIYIDDNVDGALASTKVAAEWLDEQLDKLKDELSESELALHTYKRDKQILSVSLDDQSNMLSSEMQQLSGALTQVRTQLEALRSREAQLADIDVANPTTLPSRELLESAVLNTLRASFIQASQDLNSLLGRGKGNRHPDVVAAAANVEINREALLAEVANIREALQREVKAKQAEEIGLSGLLGRAKAQALELNRLALEYRRLERAKENTEKVYSLVLERSKESDLTRHMRFNNIRFVDEAFASLSPIRPRNGLNIIVGGISGLLLGLMLAFGRHWLDRTFKTGEDVEEKLGLPLLGVLPRTSKGFKAKPGRGRRRTVGDELIVHEKPNSNAAEAARALRTNLMFASPDRVQKTLVVTSGGPFEGKTTVACWVATALAQTGKKVLLLDCDLRRPRVHQIFKRTNDLGVSTFMVSPELLASADLRTEVPNLDVMTAGPGVPNPAEVLHSERFEALLNQLKNKYDHVVIDTPPVNAVTDAAILSTKADGTMLVIRAHSTPRDSARHSARALVDVTNNLLGVVLNAFDQRHAGYRYGYGYGAYRYQYYYGNREAGDRAASTT